jgi:MoaD family protein
MRIKLFATLRDMVGAKTLDIPLAHSGTISDLLDAIGAAHPALKTKMVDEHGHLNGVVHILVNGRNTMWLDGMDTVVHTDDDIALIPPAAGG